MKKHLLWLVVLLPFFGQSQTHIPDEYYGINAWMPEYMKDVHYNGILNELWDTVQLSGVQSVRVGGIACDKNFFYDDQFLDLIDSIQKIGAEPIVQVPLWGGDSSAADAAALVTFINVTHGKNVKYWSIGNEANLVYNSSTYGFSSGNYPYTSYSADVKTFSAAMKAVDNTIKIIVGDLAWYDYTWINGLLTANVSGNNIYDITGKDPVSGLDYIDYFTFHSYPSDGSKSKTDLLNYLTGNFSTNTTHLNSLLNTANTTHSRNNDLKFAITEANVNYRNPDPNNVDGVGSNSFFAGQYLCDLFFTSLQKGAQFVNFWSVAEGGDGSVTDHGYISYTTRKLKPSYYHFQLCAKYMEDSLYTTTDNQADVKVYSTKSIENGWAIMVLNYDESNSYTTKIQLNTNAISGSETLQVNVDGDLDRSFTETVAANSTTLFFLTPNGHYIGKYTYTQADATADIAPSFTTYTPTRTPKVLAHYLPWYDDNTGGYGREGWCHEGDCTDATNKSSVYTPLIGEYSQFDPEVIKYHIRTAIAARIDGFIVNVNPDWDFQWKVFNNICDAVVEVNSECVSNDFKIIISYDNSTDTDVASITTNFQLVEDSLYNHATFKDIVWKDDITGKPILMVWSESHWNNYRTAIDAVFGKDSVIVLGQNATNLDQTDGNFGWVGYLNSALSNTANWGLQYYNDFFWIMARQEEFGLSDVRKSNTVQMLSAYPGFNDSNVPSFWNGGNDRFFARDVDEGRTINLTWDKTLNYTSKSLGGTFDVGSPWVQLVTWNDFPEGTAIEPSIAAQYSFKDLQYTRSKVASFKNVTTTNEDTLGIYVPYEIYTAEKAGRTADANTATTLFCSENYNQAYTMAQSGVLPVELISFTGKRVNQNVQLNWEVGDRINHSHFNIEHSTDGVHFNFIGKNAQALSLYEFVHTNPSEGVNYYRLHQVDYDGQFSYSDIVAVEMPYQHPFIYNGKDHQLTITATLQLSVYSMEGKQVLHQFVKQQDQVSLQHLPKGIYMVIGEKDGKLFRQRISIF